MENADSARLLNESNMASSSLRKFLRKMPLGSSIYNQARTIVRYKHFTHDFRLFRKLAEQSDRRFALSWKDRYPCLNDKTSVTGFDRHYVYHPAWAARIIARTKPALHVDIASSLHFVSMLSAFVPVKFYDYRPAELSLSNLTCEKGDLLALPFPNQSVESLSCMHVVEHVGLGRYGDPLDPEGDVKAMNELQRVLAPRGTLLFVVPIGKPRLQFNAHRIYSYDQVIHHFSALALQEFTLIPESFEDGPPIRDATRQRSDQENYGCGCFWFRRDQ
jgi:hypothetical protein